MDSSLRESGIDIIGSIPWGTHIGQFYTSKADYFEVLVPYIQSGLLNNELCTWIYSQKTSYEEVKNALIERIPAIDDYLECEQLKIIPYTAFYVEDNTFNEVRVNRKWNELIRYALEKGFDGLRAVGDTSWLEKCYFRTFANYEQNINRIISELPFIVVCLYDANHVDAFEVAEIIRNHGYVLTRYQGSLELINNVELLIKDKQLEESNERYKRLIQFLPDSVIIHDDNKIYYCNDSAAHIAGVKDSRELMQKLVLELVPLEMKPNFLRFMKKALEGGEAANYLQSKILCKNGEMKDVEIVSTGYYYQGYRTLLSVVRDVTPFKKIDELKKDIEENRELLNNTLEYDRRKTEFFSNISHELRTPLNVILSVIQLLNMHSDHVSQDSKGSKYLKMMKQNCYRLLRLVNNLIDITKMDANYFKIKLQNYDMIRLVEEITLSVVEYGKNKGITILFDTDVEEKIMACDPDQMERIILNLLSNAIKFTPAGGNIWVSVYDHGEKIEISVKDTGIGIPADKQESVFNRFQQVDGELTTRSQGSGIGLSLVKALVEKHNGKISLKSDLGKGSEFIIEIPYRILAESQENLWFTYSDNSQSHVERINIEFSDIYSQE